MEFIRNHIQKLLIIVSVILLSTIIYKVTHLIENGTIVKAQKSDYAHLHSVQYGLFNSKVWTDKISVIVEQKIDEFEFTKSSRLEIKTYVEAILDALIVEAEKEVRKKNKKRGFFDSIVGSTKQMVTDSLVDFKHLRSRVPEFTDKVIDELEKPDNQAILKTVLKEKLQQFTANNVMQPVNMAQFDAILERYETKDYAACSSKLDREIEELNNKIDEDTILILGLSVLLIIFIVLQGTLLKSASLILLSVTSVTLLIPGLMLPMLDIEAKISKLHFLILDKQVIFTDQILFYQSKSIYDLVLLLMEEDEFKMIFVGVLLTTFSIIFPTLKLLSTTLYYYSKNVIGNNPVTRFFALRSTKWSMADVMVVSIFMSYLGLDGVVSNELEKLEEISDPINIITTNGTSLQVGFFLFLGFVVASFVLSILADNAGKAREDKP
ncbi:paraquat-inducible protein A [Sulfurovum sp.]|uniref:paraquat-inducible protein A n=1 Tax=Sulfurovum sp. TaxID=1969726 RepID=UPI00286800C4|nr:paraquat-inducible protein A [Sulfurovum sp.]